MNIIPVLPAPDLPAREDGYPFNWLQISQALKNWAGNCCEVCGKYHDVESWHILTVHHLNGNKLDCRFENLLACCQRCHLVVQAYYVPGQTWLFGRPAWAERRGL